MDMQLSIEKLKQQREGRAWTQSHLAEVAGVSLRTIQRIEKSGLASPESTQAICAAYGITAEQILAERSNDVEVQSRDVSEMPVKSWSGVVMPTLIAFVVAFVISYLLSV